MGRNVVYVGSYTYEENSTGLTAYSMDEDGNLELLEEITEDNVVYLAASRDRRHLYAITDEGIATFGIAGDGTLMREGTVRTRGMRGSYLSLDAKEEFMFVAGYYDGRLSVIRMENGQPVKEVSSIHYRGITNVAEKSFVPHLSCVMMSPDQEYLCVLDSGQDCLTCYRLNRETGELREAGVLHCDIDSEPYRMVFSRDGRFLYLLYESACRLEVYSYQNTVKGPEFEKLQSLPTMGRLTTQITVGSGLRMADSGLFLLTTNAGDNSVAYFELDPETGLAELKFSLPVSGDYPVDLFIYPGESQIGVVNRTSQTITFFSIDERRNAIYMNRKFITIKEPGCVLLVGLEEECV